MGARLINLDDLSFLHLTDFDLNNRSRKKSFDRITLRDFNYCISDAARASYVFFIDERHKRGWWRNILGINAYIGNRIKQLKP